MYDPDGLPSLSHVFMQDYNGAMLAGDLGGSHYSISRDDIFLLGRCVAAPVL